jgi:hypothetical protein
MLLIAGIWSIYEFNSIGVSIPRMLDENYQSIHAAKKMVESLEREDSAILLLILGKWEEGRSILNSADSTFNYYYRMAYANITIPGEQTHLESIQSKYHKYKSLWERPIVGTQKEGNIEWYFQNNHNSFLSVRLSLEDLIDLNDRAMYQMASTLENRSNRAIMPGIVAVISAFVFTLIFNFLVNYYVVSPLIKITERIKKFKENRTPFAVNIETKDELLYLANEIGDLCALVDSKDHKR